MLFSIAAVYTGIERTQTNVCDRGPKQIFHENLRGGAAKKCSDYGTFLFQRKEVKFVRRSMRRAEGLPVEKKMLWISPF